MNWLTTRFDVNLSRAQVMGIVNVTPDSFSDGGCFADAAAAMRHCERLVAEGADMLDIGGESTRPGATAPTVAQELERVLPVLTHALTLGVPVSVDTSRPEVMRAALEQGADIINDVRSLQRPGALETLAAFPRAGVCLMHMQGQPTDMQSAPAYEDVVAEIRHFLGQRIAKLVAAGVGAERIAVDPGIGFGKTVAHNLELLARQRELLTLGRPVLVGWSRKSTLGALTDRAPQERLGASVAAALLAVQRGASVLRVHDVRDTVDALKVLSAVSPQSRPPTEPTIDTH